jgi:hypothetical protein
VKEGEVVEEEDSESVFVIFAAGHDAYSSGTHCRMNADI